MYLVDVVDLELAAGRGEADRLAQVAHLLDAVVSRAVDLEHIERAALGDFDADVLVGIEVDARATGAVEGLGEDAGGGGFAGAAWPDEQVGVGQPFLGDGVAQRAHDMILAKHVGEGFWAVFAGEDLIAHTRECRDAGGFVMIGFRGNRKISGLGIAGTGKFASMPGYG